LNPENSTKKPILLIATIAIALLLVGGAIGVFLAMNAKTLNPDAPIDLNKDIAPDVNAVPKDKPLPPAPKEAVLKQNKQQNVGQNELQMFDANKDGKVTRVEFRTKWEGQFHYLDANKDGKLVRQEWRNGAFTSMDLDKNGTLESQEWMRYRDWCYDTFLDANKDGTATPGEWKK
jgi:hypothetical protein